MIHLIAVYDVEAGGFKVEPRMVKDEDLHLYPRFKIIKDWFYKEEVAKRTAQGRRVLRQMVHYQRRNTPLNWSWMAIPDTDIEHFSAAQILANFRAQVDHPAKVKKMTTLFNGGEL